MSGNFTISLLEILAYLLPGGLILATVLYLFSPALGSRTLSVAAYQIAFVACSYIVGHLLILISFLLALLLNLLKKIELIKRPEEQLTFYQHLHRKLEIIFGPNLSRDNVYHFSNRLITDNQLPTSQVIDRLFAIMLFSRNITVSLIIAAILFAIKDHTAAGAWLGALAILFFLRYFLIERNTRITVFRAAYVYLCSKEEPEKSKPVITEKDARSTRRQSLKAVNFLTPLFGVLMMILAFATGRLMHSRRIPKKAFYRARR